MLPERARIGLVEDDPVMGGSIVQRLELEGWDVTWWTSGQKAIAEIAALSDSLDLVICDLRLPDVSGEVVFSELSKRPNPPPFMFVTGYGEIDQAVKLMRSGAVDFMPKPFAMDEFLHRIESGRRWSSQSRATSEVLGVSPAIRHVEQLLHRYAPGDLPVLITGETGAGKEIAARLLHRLSLRSSTSVCRRELRRYPGRTSGKRIVRARKRCLYGRPATPPWLCRARGSRDALPRRNRRHAAAAAGKAAAADRGRQLHACWWRGARSPSVPVSSLHRIGTWRKSGANGFRQDLYFRLAVLPVEIPALRERPEDISSLMDQFLEDASARCDRRIRGFSALTEEAALAHSWPGNIRELRNRVERAVALATNEWIMPGDLFPERSGSELRASCRWPTFETLQNAGRSSGHSKKPADKS